MVIGNDGIIMVDAELAPLHDKIKAAITDNAKLPSSISLIPIFMASRPVAMRRSIATAPSLWRRTMRVWLLAGTTNGINYNKSAPAPADAIPTETYVGGTKIVGIRGREALLTHATNAHTDGDSWIYLADANVHFHG